MHLTASSSVYSRVVGPRHPFAQDPDLDYEIDSDEEWEEVFFFFYVSVVTSFHFN